MNFVAVNTPQFQTLLARTIESGVLPPGLHILDFSMDFGMDRVASVTVTYHLNADALERFLASESK